MMKYLFILLAAITLVFIGGRVFAQNNMGPDPFATQKYQPNAYGLGTNSDVYVRPFKWQQNNGNNIAPIFQDRVRPNVYGPGVGMDQFGRPVTPNYGW